MENSQKFDSGLLDRAGLNRQAVFNIADLPDDLRSSLETGSPASAAYRQLILICHAGQALWDAVKEAGMNSEDPIDDFTARTVRNWFEQCQPGNAFEIVYPGPRMIGLQRLGELAGWHHATPLMVGIDRKWGTWFAYRAVVLADTRFAPTAAAVSEHPCTACTSKNCIATCAGGALDNGRLDLGKCIAYRKRKDSTCKATCVARLSCPVGTEHRYTDEHIRHIYSNSMRAIERYY